MVVCRGCAERREKIKEHLQAVVEWIKNPTASSKPLSLNPPPTPQVHGRPNISKSMLIRLTPTGTKSR